MAAFRRQRSCRVSLTNLLLAFILLSFLLLHLPLLLSQQSSLFLHQEHEPSSTVSSAAWIADSHSNRQQQHRSRRELEERVQYLETKVNSFLSFGENDPFAGLTVTNPTLCHNSSDLRDLYCQGENDKDCDCDNRQICLDELLPEHRTVDPPCIVYDFGIREQPEFGEAFASDLFDCEVFAFDPSPITKKFVASSTLKNYTNYHLFYYGAGGKDEELVLKEYNWGQISILQYPDLVIDPSRCNNAGVCKYKKFDEQKNFKVPVKTLSTIMKELGHSHVSLIKLDVEGSEYRFLEAMIDDLSCRNVDQITVEWHHYDYDRRYGVTSAPHINMLAALLKERCGLEQFWVHSTGWPSNSQMYSDMGLNPYYNEAAFMRVRQ